MNEIREMNDKILSDIDKVFKLLYDRLQSKKIYCKEALGVYVTFYSAVKASNNQELKELYKKTFLLILDQICEEFEDTADDTNGFQPIIISSLADALHVTEVEAALIYGGRENVATEFKDYCASKGIRYCEGKKSKNSEVDEHKALRAVINGVLGEKVDQARYGAKVAGDIIHHRWDTHYADGHSESMVKEKEAKLKAGLEVDDFDILNNAPNSFLNPQNSRLEGTIIAEEVMVIYGTGKKSSVCIVEEIFKEISGESEVKRRYKSLPKDPKTRFFLLPNVTHMGVGIAKRGDELWVTIRYREIKD